MGSPAAKSAYLSTTAAGFGSVEDRRKIFPEARHGMFKKQKAGQLTGFLVSVSASDHSP